MKKANSLTLWLIITLSGLLYSGAFLAIHRTPVCSIMMVTSLLLLFQFFYYAGVSLERANFLLQPIPIKSQIKKILIYGFWWGILVFSLHFVWIPILLATKSNAVLWQIITLYSIATLYFSLTASIWFLVTYCLLRLIHIKRSGIRLLLCLITSWLSFIMVLFFWERYAWWFLGTAEGYPFLSPLIPLARIPQVLALLCTIAAAGGSYYVNTQDIINYIPMIGYIRPCLSEKQVVVSQYLFHQLGYLQDKGKRILVAPESTYKFPLNLDRETEALLASSLGQQSQALLGGYFLEGDIWHQAAYVINNNGIQKVYTKQHSVSFVEKMPLAVCRITWLRNMFLQDRNEFSCISIKNDSDGKFFVSKTHVGIVRLCSEAFFTCSTNDFLRNCENSFKLNTMIFFLMNDSWFINYFRKIMETVCHITAAWSGLPVCYVGFQECVVLFPDGNRRTLDA